MGSASGRKRKLKTELFCGIQRKQLSYYSLKWSVDKLLMKIIVSQMPTQAVCDWDFPKRLSKFKELGKASESWMLDKVQFGSDEFKDTIDLWKKYWSW